MSRPLALLGAGEMGSRIREFDWRGTSLGPRENWSRPLVTALEIILHSPQPMFVGWGPELTLLYNDAFVPLLRERHPEALGKPCHRVWADVWNEYGPMIAQALGGGAALRDDMPFVHFTAQEVYYTFSISPLFAEGGGVAGVISIVTETTDRVMATRQARQAMQALAASEERYRRQAERLFALFEKAPGFVAVLEGPEHIVTLTNASYRQLIGARDVIGLPYREARPELEGTGAFELLDRVHATGQTFVGTGRRPVPEAAPAARPQDRYVDFIYQPIRDDAGRVSGVFIQGHDVTDRVISARKQRLLLHELNHRVMNNLATVQSMAIHTAREARDVSEFLEDFQGRLIALARTHDALAKSDWGGADVQDLLSRELLELYPGRVRLEGPPLSLNAAKAQALALVIHELATNAAKYGPLSGTDGGVLIAWSTDASGRHFTLLWEEAGGPPVSPPTRQGYGSRLIARLVKGDLAGSLETDYRREGLRVRIVGTIA